MICNPTVSGYLALALLAVFLIVCGAYCRHQWKLGATAQGQGKCISGTSALESAKLIKDWCVWLATVCIAAIAANGFLAPPQPSSTSNICARESFAVLAILFFLATLVCTATLLVALPGIVARVDPGATCSENDFHDQTIFPVETIPGKLLAPLLRVEFVAAMQYLFFLAGVLFFSGYAAMRFF